MTNSSTHLHHSSYAGNDQVVVVNGNLLNITSTSTSHVLKNLKLLDVLVVPHITKNLLSISKLTHDSPVDVILSNTFFAIQNLTTKEIIAKGRCEAGVYILEQGNETFLAALRN